MQVTVLCFGLLRDRLPEDKRQRPLTLEIPEGATVKDVVSSLGLPERSVFAILVDGGRGSLDHVLGTGAEVTLMPAFSGGRSPATPES
jgi:sulfur carrier protein ThiS